MSKTFYNVKYAGGRKHDVTKFLFHLIQGIMLHYVGESDHVLVSGHNILLFPKYVSSQVS